MVYGFVKLWFNAAIIAGVSIKPADSLHSHGSLETQVRR